ISRLCDANVQENEQRRTVWFPRALGTPVCAQYGLDGFPEHRRPQEWRPPHKQIAADTGIGFAACRSTRRSTPKKCGADGKQLETMLSARTSQRGCAGADQSEECTT